MSAHTPGPWSLEMDQVEDGTIDVFAHHPGDFGVAIAAIDVRDFPEDDTMPARETALANAHLITAAPELLEALRVFVREAECYHESCHDAVSVARCDSICHALPAARAAIAKADGLAEGQR